MTFLNNESWTLQTHLIYAPVELPWLITNESTMPNVYNADYLTCTNNLQYIRVTADLQNL